MADIRTEEQQVTYPVDYVREQIERLRSIQAEDPEKAVTVARAVAELAEILQRLL